MFLAQMAKLFPGDASIRRTREATLNEGFGFGKILNVFLKWSFPAIWMRIGVISNRMTFINDPLKKFRMIRYLLSKYKKASSGIELFQLIEHPISHSWNWSVVEGQVNNLS